MCDRRRGALKAFEVPRVGEAVTRQGCGIVREGEVYIGLTEFALYTYKL